MRPMTAGFSLGPERRFKRFGLTELFAGSMNDACAHTVAFVGDGSFAHFAGSSWLGLVRVTSSRRVTRCPRVSRVTTSLLIAALPRTLTLFCRTSGAPGPEIGSPGAAGVLGAGVAVGGGAGAASSFRGAFGSGV